MSVKRKVLFLCTGNACRSPMAEGILRYLADERLDVFSAGTHPTQVHPLAIKVMKEWGVDISHQTSNYVTDFLHKGIDVVITLSDSAQALCPPFHTNAEILRWNIPDPFPGWVDDPRYLVRFREVRNLLRSKIETFLQSH